MLAMLVAYDEEGSIIATLDHVVALDPDGIPLGLVDFEAHDLAGGELTDIWKVEGAAGSKTWPEWLGGQAHAFRVELEGSPGAKRLKALVHLESGHRRTRAAIEAEVDRRVQRERAAAHAEGVALRRELVAEGIGREAVAHVTDPDPRPVDLRDLLGGPDRPIALDDAGRTAPPAPPPRPTKLPLLSASLIEADQRLEHNTRLPEEHV